MIMASNLNAETTLSLGIRSFAVYLCTTVMAYGAGMFLTVFSWDHFVVVTMAVSVLVVSGVLLSGWMWVAPLSFARLVSSLCGRAGAVFGEGLQLVVYPLAGIWALMLALTFLF